MYLLVLTYLKPAYDISLKIFDGIVMMLKSGATLVMYNVHLYVCCVPQSIVKIPFKYD